MLNFHQSLPCLNWLFPLHPVPKDFPKLDPDCLAPHHPIPNAKFPPITALLNRPTYHKSAKVSHHSFPKSYGNLKSMNKLTLNEPAIIFHKIENFQLLRLRLTDSGMWLVVICPSLNYCPNLSATDIGAKNPI